ncbi:MAG TPA: site-specific integrase [Terracidiphilus sp.]
MTTRARGEGRIFSRKGSAFLWCAYYLRGKEYRESTGETDPQRAAKYLKRRLKEVGADQIGIATFIGPQQERLKVCKLLDALEDDYKLRGKDSPQFRSKVKQIREFFGAWRAVEVTAEAVDKYIAERLEAGTAAATINRCTQFLAQAFRLAVDRKHLSAAPHIRHLSEKGNARQGFFADADFRALVSNLPAYLQDFVRFGYLTGWRKGEIASLRWEDVDPDVIRLRGENAKNGEGRSVTLGGELGDLIERRKAARHIEKKEGETLLAAFVFHLKGEPVGDFRKAWATACVAAGLGRFVCDRCKQAVDGHWCEQCNVETTYSGRIFHDFRRTAVRNMVRAGVPERVAMTISGHKTRSIFDRYNIVNEADLRDAMQRTQDYLKESAQQPKRPAVMQMVSSK